MSPSCPISPVFQLKVSTYDNQPLLSGHQQKSVHVSVVQQRQTTSTWAVHETVDPGARTWNSSVLPSPAEPEEMELPVPAGGVIRLVIPLRKDTQLLSIDVRALLRSSQVSVGQVSLGTLRHASLVCPGFF